ncbi:MAG: caspase family protein [Saprospiraceae bacterium]|nr:caspase family protein [Saprospiraceae bacterium]
MQATQDKLTTTTNIKAAFIDLERKNIKDGDLVVIFISSHGKINHKGEFILMPSDYNSAYEELYSINFREDILDKLKLVEGNKLVFIDACHSGSAFNSGSRSFSDAAASQMLNKLIQNSSGLEIIASCGENEYSYEDKSWGNGAFTKSILEAFRGETIEVDGGKKICADIFNEAEGVKKNGKDGVITIEELKLFIQQRVPHLVRTTKVAPPTEQRPSNKSTDLLPQNLGIFVTGQNN